MTPSTNIALKEWAAVVGALESGEQTILLRKGGIVEHKQGFRLRHRQFLLFPAHEHQHARFLKPGSSSYQLPIQTDSPKEAPGQATPVLRIGSLAEADLVLEAPSSLDAALPLLEETIWNEDFLSQRYAYRPELPGWLLFLRVWRFPEPIFLPDRQSYAGCKSWVHLTEEVSLLNLTPVLSDEEFAERRKGLLRRLGRHTISSD